MNENLPTQLGPKPPDQFRAVTLNLWGEQPPLGQRLGLVVSQILELSPDVVALQEVREVGGAQPVANTARTLAEALGMTCVYQKTVAWGDGDEGLAILSRHPVVEQGHVRLPHAMPDKADERILLWALLDTGQGQVLCGSTHLTYRMTHGQERVDQILAIVQTLDDLRARLMPGVTVLMGDFNAAPDTDEIRFLRGLTSQGGRRVYFQDAYLVQPARPAGAGSDPRVGATWSRRNPAIQKLRFLEMDRRIDYIFVSQASRDGRGLVQRCAVTLDRADADDAAVFPSDHFGVVADIQLVPLL